jgi:uncharacterized protein (TIGR03067 family)
MKRCLLVVCVVLSLAAGKDRKGPVKEELKKLQGTWEATKITFNGDEVSEDDTGKISLTIKGDSAAVGANKKIKGEYGKVKLKVDPSVTPKTIDVSVARGDKKGVKLEGIYKLEKDTLTLCIKVLGTERPDKFESPAGESIALVVMKKKAE